MINERMAMLGYDLEIFCITNCKKVDIYPRKKHTNTWKEYTQETYIQKKYVDGGDIHTTRHIDGGTSTYNE